MAEDPMEDLYETDSGPAHSDRAQEPSEDHIFAQLYGDGARDDKKSKDTKETKETKDEDSESDESEDDVAVVLDGDVKRKVNIPSRPNQYVRQETGSETKSKKEDFAARSAAVLSEAKTRKENDQRSLALDETIFDLNIETLLDKPWRRPGADITDYFNFDFDEDTWRSYCEKQIQMRMSRSMQGGKIAVYDGRAPVPALHHSRFSDDKSRATSSTSSSSQTSSSSDTSDSASKPGSVSIPLPPMPFLPPPPGGIAIPPWPGMKPPPGWPVGLPFPPPAPPAGLFRGGMRPSDTIDSSRMDQSRDHNRNSFDRRDVRRDRDYRDKGRDTRGIRGRDSRGDREDGDKSREKDRDKDRDRDNEKDRDDRDKGERNQKDKDSSKDKNKDREKSREREKAKDKGRDKKDGDKDSDRGKNRDRDEREKKKQRQTG